VARPALDDALTPRTISPASLSSLICQGAGADRLRDLTRRSAKFFGASVHMARSRAGQTGGDFDLARGQGRAPSVPTLKGRFGSSDRGDFRRRSSMSRPVAGLNTDQVHGADCLSLDTRLRAKRVYGLESLKTRDFLLLHSKRPTMLSLGRAGFLTKSHRASTDLIIGPLLAGLVRSNFAILLMPDSSTPINQ